jgi:glycosyltransferase involved in cell wall biosynthesis
MKISVVIPALNEQGFIEKAVASLVGQSLPRRDFEIIVVDNGSTDETSALAKRAGADCVVFEPMKGLSAARARGLAQATAPIIAFLDADCLAPPNWLERILRTFAAKPHIIALGGAYDLSADSQIQRLFSVFWQRLVIPCFTAAMTVVWKPAAVLFGGNYAARRDILARIGFDANFVFYGEDTATALALAKCGTVCWDPSLTVKSSNRRYRDEGAFRLFVRYVLTWFSVYFRGKPPKF